MVADSAKNIVAQDPLKVKCGFWDGLGPKKTGSLVFTWTENYIPPGKYKLKFSLVTPSTSGNHHLTILTMARFYPYIYLKKDYDFIFSAMNDGWEESFPRMYYSSGWNANNAKLPD